MTAAVIDLGDVSGPATGPDGYPAGQRRRRHLHRTTAGRCVIVAVAVLALGGSGLPGPPVLRQTWSTPFSDSDEMTIFGDIMFLYRSVAGGDSELTAHDIVDGTTRWSRRIPGEPAWTAVLHRAGVLLVPSGERLVERILDDGSVVNYLRGGKLTALDPATGQQLWERDGMPAENETGESLLTFEQAEDGKLTSLRLISSRTGAIRWERQAPPGAERVAVISEAGVPTRVVTASAEGELTILAFADGRPQNSRRVSWTPVSQETGEGSQLTTAGGRILVVSNSVQRSEVTAYHPEDLRRLWSRTMPGWTYAQSCGAVICLIADGDFTTAVEASTGEQRWEFRGSPARGTPDGEERILFNTGNTVPGQAVLDAATGRQVGPPISGYMTFQDSLRGSVILVRSLAADPNRNVVSRLDLSTGRTTTFGAVSIAEDQYCEGTGRHLVCFDGNRLVITAVG